MPSSLDPIEESSCRAQPAEHASHDVFEETSLDPVDRTAIESALAATVAAHHGESGFRLLTGGIEAFQARSALARIARRTLDVQYYIFHDDSTGRMLANALCEAADRGVKVRLLLDDLNVRGRDFRVAALDAHPNIDVKLFNPFRARDHSFNLRLVEFLFHTRRLNRRMHNKAFVADGMAAIVGGRNVGDEYFDASRITGFGDLDLLAAGPIVAQVVASFEAFWNHRAAMPVAALDLPRLRGDELASVRASLAAHTRNMSESEYGRALRSTTFAQALPGKDVLQHWGPGQVVADLPNKIECAPDEAPMPMLSALEDLAREARSEVNVISPYFIPGERGVARFRALTARGVRVRVLTNSLAATDVPAVHSGYARYREALLDAGDELYELRPFRKAFSKGRRWGLGSSRASLHAKAYVFDAKTSFVGSMNIDQRSIALNTELAMIVRDAALAMEVVQWFEAAVTPAYSYRVERNEEGALRWTRTIGEHVILRRREPEAGWLRRLSAKIYALLPIQDQL